MDPITYLWENIKDLTVDEKGVKVELKEGDEITETPPKPTEAKYPRPLSTDSIDTVLDEAKFVNADDGTLTIPDVVVIKSLVQDYEGVGKVLKPADEVVKTLQYWDHRPICDDHPPDGFVTDPNQVKGYCINPRVLDSSIVCDLTISCSELIGKITSGDKREVSPGFQSDYVKDSGDLDGAEYGFKQTNIYPDHLAIVDHGRCSLIDGCGIQPDVLKEAKAVVADKKAGLVSEIAGTSKAKSKEELNKMSLDALTKDLAFIKKVEAEAKTSAKLRARDTQDKSGRTAIDEAYAKI